MNTLEQENSQDVRLLGALEKSKAFSKNKINSFDKEKRRKKNLCFWKAKCFLLRNLHQINSGLETTFRQFKEKVFQIQAKHVIF